MKSNFIITSLGIAALFILTSCASLEKANHSYIMRGQILESKGDGVYLCTGSADGATIGQVLNVYRYTKVANPQNIAKSKFRREETGKVKITEIVDEHYAKAKILTGEAKENSIVELHE
jgi:ribosomal protein L24